MLKKLLGTTVLFLAASGSAQAQASFSHGDITFGVFAYSGGSGVFLFELAGRGDYDLGGVGLQIDATAQSITDFTFSAEGVMAGAHLYWTTAGGNKIGGYAALTAFPSLTSTYFYNAGAEGIFDLGAVDVEASAGVVGITSASSSVAAGVSVFGYFDATADLEISAGVRGIYPLDGGGGSGITAVVLGASYDLPGNPWELGAYASQTFGSGGGTGQTVFGLSVTYNIGASGGDRLFRQRGYDVFKDFGGL